MVFSSMVVAISSPAGQFRSNIARLVSGPGPGGGAVAQAGVAVTRSRSAARRPRPGGCARNTVSAPYSPLGSWRERAGVRLGAPAVGRRAVSRVLFFQGGGRQARRPREPVLLLLWQEPEGGQEAD